MQGTWGVKAIYIWAGMLVPTIAILYIYYPRRLCISHPVFFEVIFANLHAIFQTCGRTYWELDEVYEAKDPR